MSTFKITFPENSTLPQLLAELAQNNGVTPETLIIRAVAEYLRDFGINPVGTEEPEVTNLAELFSKTGATRNSQPQKAHS